MSKGDNEKQWVAYSCCGGINFFDTQEDAELWILGIEQDDEICPDAMAGECFVAKVASRSEFVVVDRKEDDPENWSYEWDEMGYLRFAPLKEAPHDHQ